MNCRARIARTSGICKYKLPAIIEILQKKKCFSKFSTYYTRLFHWLPHSGMCIMNAKNGNQLEYHKTPKISDTRKFAVITLKVDQDGFSLE